MFGSTMSTMSTIESTIKPINYICLLCKDTFDQQIELPNNKNQLFDHIKTIENILNVPNVFTEKYTNYIFCSKTYLCPNCHLLLDSVKRTEQQFKKLELDLGNLKAKVLNLLKKEHPSKVKLQLVHSTFINSADSSKENVILEDKLELEKPLRLSTNINSKVKGKYEFIDLTEDIIQKSPEISIPNRTILPETSTNSATLLTKINSVKKNIDGKIQSNNEEKFECEYCFEIFDSIKLKNKHEVKRHYLKCTKCPLKFLNEDILNEHLAKHDEELINVCKKCLKNFLIKEELDHHMRIKHPVPNLPCLVCEELFVDKRTLNRHKRLIHGQTKVERVWQCHKCLINFESRKNKEEHMSKKHPKLCRYKCEINQDCQKIFFRKNALNNHVKKCIHFIKPKINNLVKKSYLHSKSQFQCNYCGIKKNTLGGLNLHIKRHEEKSEKAKKIMFLNSLELEKEKSLIPKDKNKNMEKLYSCPICTKTFSGIFSLEMHEKSHVPKNKKVKK